MSRGAARKSLEDISEVTAKCHSETASGKVRAAAYSGRLVEIWDEPRIFIYVGEHGDHVIVDGVYCSCEAFTYSLLRGGQPCYHLCASRLRDARFRRLNLDVDEAWEVIFESLAAGFSATLHRKLGTRGRS